MKRLGLLVFLLGLPSMIWALPAVVTTGEHSDFTRLVVTLSEESDWRLGRVSDGYTLSVNQQDLEYDLRKAFTRIPKTRLADVRQVPQTSDLHIVAACPCYVTAFAFRSNVIVIDIRVGAPPADSVFEEPLISFAAAKPSPTNPVPSISEPGAEIALDWTGRLNVSPKPAKPGRDLMPQLPAGFRETIVEQLGSAASQGLVTLESTKPREAKEPPATATSVQPMVDTPFRVMTEAGMEMRLGGSLDQEPALQEECLPGDAVDLAAWGKTDQNPADTLSGIHRMLVTDADHLPEDQLANAAKQYLYLGFGAEARLALAAITTPKPQHSALSDMGFIMDGAQLAQSAFNGMEGCESSAALWAVLARDHLRPSEPIASGAIVQAFSTLPYHLRELLGARLIDRLLEQGDESSARMIRDTIRRTTEQAPPAMQLAEAQLEMRENRPEAARVALQAASAAPGPDEAAALVALIDMDFTAKQSVPADRIEMLETLIAQNRGQQIENELKRALVLAYALSGEFGLAKQALENAPAATEGFWALMAQRGSDADILDLAFSPPPEQTEIDAPSVLAIAQKLRVLGFPEQTLEWLGVPRTDLATLPDTTRLTIAEAQLAIFQPREAMATISGLDERANSVRVKALRAMGQLEEAMGLLRDNADAVDELVLLQQTTQQWQALASQGQGTWTEAATLAVEAGQPLPVQPSVTLAGANATAAKAEESRGLIGALLQETQLLPSSP